MSVLKMYFAADDTQVSPEADFTNPVSFTLRADLEENDQARLYAMCDAGYQATSSNVQEQGTTAARWSLASDTAGTPGTFGPGPLALGTVGAGAPGRVYFWARADALSSEEIGVDNTVTLKLEGIGEAI